MIMPRKSLKNILMEVVLFITIVALTGHLTVNFWERYIVRNELSDMKHSLDHLKVTVHNIGDAYDDLQRDLIDMARINSKPSISPNDVFSCKKSKDLDQKILRNLQVLLMKANDKIPVIRTADKDIGNIPITTETVNKNATTLTRYPAKATAVGSESAVVFNECAIKNKCRYKSMSNDDLNVHCDDFDNCSCGRYKYLKL